MDAVLNIVILTYMLAAFIILLIPESWFRKQDFYHEMGVKNPHLRSHVRKPGYYIRLFLLSGLAVVLLIICVKHLVK